MLENNKAKLQKIITMFKKKPEAAILHPSVKAYTKDGIVILKTGNFSWTEDLPPSLGGTNTTIGPLQHLLGSLAGCGAGIIKNTLAPLMDIQVDSIEVETKGNFDLKGVLGIPGAIGDLTNVEFIITIYSNDAPNKIEKLLDVWKQRAPVYLCFQKKMDVNTKLKIKKGKKKGERAGIEY